MNNNYNDDDSEDKNNSYFTRFKRLVIKRVNFIVLKNVGLLLKIYQILIKNSHEKWQKVAVTGEKSRSSRSSCYWLKYPKRLSHRNNWLRVVYIWVLSYGEKNNNNNNKTRATNKQFHGSMNY